MAVRPILFSPDMVSALLDGIKSQTRRVITPRSETRRSLFFSDWTDDFILNDGNKEWRERCLDFQAGDLLWVRERWGIHTDGEFWYYSFGEGYTADHVSYDVKWKPSIHMKRIHSRLTLRVTDARIQRLQDISEIDAKAEGTAFCRLCGVAPWLNDKPNCPKSGGCDGIDWRSYKDAFCEYWDSLNKSRNFDWASNPWVAAYSFEVIHKNVDEVKA